MIGERIKELREERGFSQAELAKRLGVTRSSVNAWEMGISSPTTQYIVEMARLFYVSADFLLGMEKRWRLSIEGLTEQEIQVLLQLVECFRNNHRQEGEA